MFGRWRDFGMKAAGSREALAAMLAARRARAAAFPEAAPSPGWTMMLELYLARLEGRRLRADALLAGARRSALAAELCRLCAAGLVVRSGRDRESVDLSPAAAARMCDHFADLPGANPFAAG